MHQPLTLNSRASLTGHLRTTLSSTIPNHTTWLFAGPGFPRDHESIEEISSIKRAFEMKVLGVTFTDTLSMSAHVQHLGAKSAQTVYALRTLRAHGLCGEALWIVTRAHIISRLTHASSVWWGFCNAGERS